MHHWTPKTLVGTFMGGLKPKIADGIKMFKKKTLKEASLAEMRDDQLNRQGMRLAPTFNMKLASSMKQLSWNEMEKVSVLIVMRSLIHGIDVKDHSYYYWREVKRMKKWLFMIQIIHFMLSRDQLNL